MGFVRFNLLQSLFGMQGSGFVKLFESTGFNNQLISSKKQAYIQP